MKNISITLYTFLLLICPLGLLAEKLPRVAYFDIPKGRSIESQSAINKLGNARGVVAINFVMDKKGKVSSAKIDVKHTTVKDKAFVDKVLAAVLSMRFNKNKNGPENQNGSLAYVFN